MLKKIIDKRKNSPGKLRWHIVKMLLLAWLLPVAVFTTTLITITSARFNSQIENTVVSSSEKAIDICRNRLENAKSASKNASYFTTIRDSIYEYRRDNDHLKLYDSINQFLSQQYRYNDDFAVTIVCPIDDTEDLFFTVNNSIGSTYENIKAFRYNVKDKALEVAKGLDTDIAFIMANGKLYMIRNIMGAHYTPVAVIIMEMNTDSIFESLESVVGYKDCQIILDGYIVKDCTNDNKNEFSALDIEREYGTDIVHEGRKAWVIKNDMLNDSSFVYILKLDGDAIFSDINVIKYMIIIMAACLIPLIILVFYSFHKRITHPVDQLSIAAGKIAEGDYGYQIEEDYNSEEFKGLSDAFNSMSEELRYQFEQRYIEELALRDANIRALQSQINPHFLNNTLEIINWEARFSGNEKICGMIEALSTMTEATMNRKKQPMVTLREELTYVDAYLYIIKQRFGSKFTLETKVDEVLLDVMVPRLIIQPIIENAVDHGGDMYGRKQVELIIERDDNDLRMIIRNNGCMSQEDIEKIKVLLGDNYDEKNDTSTSIGIRNVNRRLKIIYGKEYGLTIAQGDDNTTVSILTARIV